jgi:competence protein ComEC
LALKFLVFSWVRATVCVTGAGVLILCAVFAQPLYYRVFGYGNTFVYDGRGAVHFVDVGHGDCTILQLPDGKTAIIDGGEAKYYYKTLGNYIDKRLGRHAYFDYVINTHPHSDHLSGLTWLMQNYRYGVFVDYKNFDEYAIIAGAGYCMQIHAIARGIAVGTDADEDQSVNEISPIITVEMRNVVFVITGDAGFSTELQFYQDSETARQVFGGRVVGKTWNGVAWSGAGNTDGRAVYLQIGHHGSQHSTSTPFLEFIRPNYAVIPMSAQNTYGHPHKTVTDKLDYIGATTYRTSDVGNIVVAQNIASVDMLHYFGFDNPPNLTALWIIAIILFIVLCFVEYHYILWQKKF